MNIKLIVKSFFYSVGLIVGAISAVLGAIHLMLEHPAAGLAAIITLILGLAWFGTYEHMRDKEARRKTTWKI